MPLNSHMTSSVRCVCRPPETPREPMEFLSRSWSVSALEISKVLSPAQLIPTLNGNGGVGVKGCGGPSSGAGIITEDIAGELAESAAVTGNPFSFASSETSQIVMERIMSQCQDLSSGRPSHSSGPLNGGSLSDSPPASPAEADDEYCRLNNPVTTHYMGCTASGTAVVGGGGKTVGRWLKDRKEKKKEETRAHNAQLHAAITVAGVASAIAAIAAATASSSAKKKDENIAKTDMAVASAATLLAAQCVEAAEAMGAEREHLASAVSSAVNVRSAGDIMTLTAAAATALRGAATLKTRAMKEVWNIASVIPMEKGMGAINNGGSNGSSSGELAPQENFLGICSKELLARGGILLKRTRNGELHWKVVSVYINKMGQVILKMKSRHVAGTITKKKKNVVVEVVKGMPVWPGRQVLEGDGEQRYFGLKTMLRGVVEFECKNQREYDIWTQGVLRLLAIAAEKNNRHLNLELHSY